MPKTIRDEKEIFGAAPGSPTTARFFSTDRGGGGKTKNVFAKESVEFDDRNRYGKPRGRGGGERMRKKSTVGGDFLKAAGCNGIISRPRRLLKEIPFFPF